MTILFDDAPSATVALIDLMIKSFLRILSSSLLLLIKQTSVEVVAMVMKNEGSDDPWAREDTEVVAVAVVDRDDSPVKVVVVMEDSSELGTASVLT